MRKSLFWVGLTLAILAITLFADLEVGHGTYLWLFTILNLLILYAARIGRVSWFYVFMAVFFFLGCWLKVAVHHILDYPYIEPAGNFGGTEEEWRNYYITASLIGLALITARLILGLLEVQAIKRQRWQMTAGRVTNSEWGLLIFLAAIFYALNNIFAFFVTGVDARLVLPFGLNAPLAFMALIGFAVIVSYYLARDVDARGQLGSKGVIAVLLVSAMASVSMASRAAIVMQSVPMLIAATYVQATMGSRAVSLRPFFLFGAFLLGVLVLVSVYRINVFSESTAEDTDLLISYAKQSAMLVIDRWIGAEAIMVAVSEPTRSMGLMMKLFQEDAASGTSAIYQVLSGSQYEFLEGLTFLTLPGYFGILGLSGSGFVIFTGTLLLTLAGIFYECVLRRALFGQAICVAIISAAIANAVTQMSFPRLFIPFIFQMTALVLILHYLSRKRFIRV